MTRRGTERDGDRERESLSDCKWVYIGGRRLSEGDDSHKQSTDELTKDSWTRDEDGIAWSLPKTRHSKQTARAFKLPGISTEAE